jgi:mercuric ion transport protein
MNDDHHLLIKPSNDMPRGNLAAIGGIIGAVLAASCCVVPLVLVTLGVSGAWIGSLTVLEPYKPVFAVITVGLLGLGFWQVYFKPREACEEGAYCASPTAGRLTKSALWIGTVIVLLALSIDYWAPLFY